MVSPLGSWVLALPSGAKPPAKTSHWSRPLLPAFCHIIELMARSASTR